MRLALAAMALLAAMVGPALGQEAIAYPDPTLTPGAIRSTHASAICSTGTSQFRHWDSARADRIYKLYGVTPAERINYTLDHLIPLEIGGADVVENLWPEPRRSLAGEWDDLPKDQLARRLAALCVLLWSKRKGESPTFGLGPRCLPRARSGHHDCHSYGASTGTTPVSIVKGQQLIQPSSATLRPWAPRSASLRSSGLTHAPSDTDGGKR